MPTTNPRITFMVSEETHKKIVDYQYENKCKNQSQAILELIAQGLDRIHAEEENEKRAEIDALAAMDLNRDEAELISNYRKLNADGRAMALGMVESLGTNPVYTKDTSLAVG